MNSKKNNLNSIIKNDARQLFCPAYTAMFVTNLLTLTSLPRVRRVVKSFGLFAALVVGLVLLPPPATMQSRTPVDFTVSGKVQRKNGANLGAFTPTTAGSLDPTFSEDGKVTTPVGNNYDAARAVAVQTDGKIVAVGFIGNGTNYGFALSRYNIDGSLDTSFDTDGKVTSGFGVANAVAIQPDGKIIAAGNSYNGSSQDFALARYNTDGSLDTSFDGDGKLMTDFGGNFDSASAVAIQSNGKIVAAGSSYNGTTESSVFALVRYNVDGSLDASFDGDGKVTTDFDGYGFASDAAIQADGKIVVAGGGYGFGFAIARYNADGSLDTSFDTDGKVITPIGGYDVGNAIAIQADGKIVVGGAGYIDFSDNIYALVRYNSNGSLDTSFDDDGKVTTDFGNPTAVAIQADGKIVAAGYSGGFALARFNTNGSPDTSFDADGRVFTLVGDDYSYAYAVAIQADGKIIAAGDGYNTTTGNDFALVRYNTDGSLDTSFDIDGKVTTNFSRVTDMARGVAVQPDGRIVTVGSSGNGENSDFALVRYRFDGVEEIIQTTPIGSGNDAANAVAIQTDGKIIAAGYSSNGSSRDFAVVRYNIDGSLDTTFDGDGKVITDLGVFDDEALAVAVQADGKIVAAGYSSLDNEISFSFALVRYNPDGSLDTSFDGDGKVITQSVQSANAIVIQTDGKIIAAGYYPDFVVPTGFIADFALVRYNPNGSLDTSFDGDGIVNTHFGNASGVQSIALQPDGKIVTAGYNYNGNNNFADFALARYNPNGSLDTSFDGDGKVTTPTVSSIGAANAVAIQSNGKIVAAGIGIGINNDFTLVRYNTDGSLDTSFDSDGKLTTDFSGNDDRANAVAIQSNGRIVAAGSSDNGSTTNFAVARYISDASAPRRTLFDFDGDGKTDISVFRPSDRVWYLNQSTAGFSAAQFGLSSDKIAPADYDDDGKTDIAVFRDGIWYLQRSVSGFTTIQFGQAGDVPVPADYDGDGRADVAVFRPNGVWYILQSSNNQFRAENGIASDKPVPADFDGDGKTEAAVYRNGTWHWRRSSDGGFRIVQFGLATDKPVVGDYDGDGKADLAVFRPGTNVWYVLRSGNDGFFALQFALTTDIQTPGDYDGDGKTDIAVFRPSDGVWYILRSSDGNISYQQFGFNGDTPTPSAFIPQ